MAMQLATCSSESVRVWDYQAKKFSSKLALDNLQNVQSLSWNHTNQVLALAGENEVTLVHAQSGQQLSSIPFPGSEEEEFSLGSISSVGFSPNSRYIAHNSSNYSSSIFLWDLKKRVVRSRLEVNRNENNNVGGDVSAISFFPDGKLISGCSLGIVRIWDLKSNSSSFPLISNINKQTSVVCVRPNPTGQNRLAASYSTGEVCVFDSNSLSLVKQFSFHTNSVSSIAFSPKNSRLIASCGADGKLALTDSNSKGNDPTASVSTIYNFTSLSFHEDAIQTAVSTSEGKVLIYDWRNVRVPICTFDAHPFQHIHFISFQNNGSNVSNNNASSTSEVSPIGKNKEKEVLIKQENVNNNSVNILNNNNNSSSNLPPPVPIKSEINTNQTKLSDKSIPPPFPDISMNGNNNNNNSMISQSSFPSLLVPSSQQNQFQMKSQNSQNLKTAQSIVSQDERKLLNTSFNTTSSFNSNSISRENNTIQNRKNQIQNSVETSNNNNISSSNIESTNNNNNNLSNSNNNLNNNLNDNNLPVSRNELRNELSSLRYDIHKEIQVIIREQHRLFAYAKNDTAELIEGMSKMLSELLLANEELRAENDRLRKMF